MNTLEVVPNRLFMARGSVLRVEDGPGRVLQVWKGSMWLTQEGDPRDYHLSAGQRFALERKGTVVSALSRAVISITKGEAA